jgi:hypothetical protein
MRRPHKAEIASQTVCAWIDTLGVDMFVDANKSAGALARVPATPPRHKVAR